MRVLVLGAEGFIGRQLVGALVSGGHEAVKGVRKSGFNSHAIGDSVPCDFGRDVDVNSWSSRLSGIEVVVNCVGILRERSADTFERIHVEAPRRLFAACAKASVRRIIQISALGDAADGEFIASKLRGDALLTESGLDYVILRPSVVYSPRGSYGGTSLLRALASLPAAIFLPVSGDQKIQPISGDDLGALVVKLCNADIGSVKVLEAVGPDRITLREYLLAWRRWLRLPTPFAINLPVAIIWAAAWFGESMGSGPLGQTMYRMLTRGNIGSDGAADRLEAILGRPLQSVEHALATHPSFVQDRWHARLYFLAPLLRLALSVVWIGSGIAGFATPEHDIVALLGNAGVHSGAIALVYGASLLDMTLGVLLLGNKWVSTITGLMLVSLFAYTAFVGIRLPELWLEPFGGLLKNIALIPAVAIVAILADRK